MEITRIYSDLYGEERLYSVLITEDEMRIFSEKKAALLSTTAGGGIGAAIGHQIAKAGGKTKGALIGAGIGAATMGALNGINYLRKKKASSEGKAVLGTGGSIYRYVKDN